MPFYQHQGCRADRARDSTGGRRIDYRRVDDAGRRRSRMSDPAGVDKGKGGKYLILPPGYKEKFPTVTLRCRRRPISGYALLRSNRQEWERRRYRQGRRLWKTDQALSALASGQSAADKVRRRDRRRVRQHHPLRSAFLSSRSIASCKESHGWSATRHDRSAQDDRHRERKPFNPDASTQKILNDAAREAHAWIDN